MRHGLTAFVLAALLTACSQQASVPSFSEADAATIRVTADAYVKAVRENNWTAWADFYVPDALVLAPNAPAIRGRDAMVEWARALPPVTSFTRTSDEVEGSGDIAYLRGGYQWVLSPPNGPAMPDSGKYIQIWRRQPDGTWKIVRAIFNSDLPAAAPQR